MIDWGKLPTTGRYLPFVSTNKERAYVNPLILLVEGHSTSARERGIRHRDHSFSRCNSARRRAECEASEPSTALVWLPVSRCHDSLDSLLVMENLIINGTWTLILLFLRFEWVINKVLPCLCICLIVYLCFRIHNSTTFYIGSCLYVIYGRVIHSDWQKTWKLRDFPLSK